MIACIIAMQCFLTNIFFSLWTNVGVSAVFLYGLGKVHLVYRNEILPPAVLLQQDSTHDTLSSILWLKLVHCFPHGNWCSACRENVIKRLRKDSCVLFSLKCSHLTKNWTVMFASRRSCNMQQCRGIGFPCAVIDCYCFSKNHTGHSNMWYDWPWQWKSVMSKWVNLTAWD